MDDIFRLIQSPRFWATFAVSGATLAWLRIMAGEELKKARLVWTTMGQRRLEPPGLFGISVGGTRLLNWGEPAARFFNPRFFFELIFTEPTLIAWYVAGWFVVLQQWEQLLLWLPAAFLWRLIWDVLMVKAPVGAPDSRGGRCFVKSAWAAASGVFYACISICVLAALMILLCVIGFLAAGSGSNRQRRRRD